VVKLKEINQFVLSKKMKILFIAPEYLDLYKIILSELINEGYDVNYLEDKYLKYDSYLNCGHSITSLIKKYSKRCVSNLMPYEEYYKQHDKLLFQKYDILLTINGFCIRKSLIKRLQRYNPDIKTRLYLWDNIRAYDFRHVIKLFDKCYSLDYEDCEKIKKLTFFPTFWNGERNKNFQIKYKVSMIGTMHDDRYFVSKRISEILNYYGYRYFIKVVAYDKERKYQDDPLITYKFYSPEEFNEIMSQSECILDTERIGQTGPTVRMIWALALGKKVITTNQYIKKMPFYNPDQICIIDRRHPYVDRAFLVKNFITHSLSPYFLNLRIDNWIKFILL